MKSRTLLVSTLLFGSGACALIYQTLWLREFACARSPGSICWAAGAIESAYLSLSRGDALDVVSFPSQDEPPAPSPP